MAPCVHMTITYSPANLYQKNSVKHGISNDVENKYKSDIQHAVEKVEQTLSDKKYGFISVLDRVEEIQSVKTVFHSIRWAKTLVVIGIGGSDLGARAIQQAIELDEPPMQVLFHGDSTDPVAITRLMRSIEVEETVFCIISKSGETIETISQYVFLKSVVKKKTEEWSEHFVFITDREKGILREEAQKHHVLTLVIPDDVGGRFSVQTTVGLLPAMAMGVDIDEFLDGGRYAIREFQGIAQEIAKSQFLLNKQGIDLAVLMPYAIQLNEFSRWYRQLWAESLGKEGKGILPIQAYGPADQHSQVQFYTQGKLLQSLLFLKIEQREDFPIEDVDIEAIKYLAGHSFHEILNVEQYATELALKKIGRPSAVLSIEKLNAFGLGALFLLFELTVVYLAEMFEINAFDQPGVEEGKQIMYALLNRDGWEEKRKEVEKLMG